MAQSVWEMEDGADMLCLFDRLSKGYGGTMAKKHTRTLCFCLLYVAPSSVEQSRAESDEYPCVCGVLPYTVAAWWWAERTRIN